MRFVEKEPLSVRVCVILFRFKVIKLQNQIFLNVSYGCTVQEG